jgi:osmoprotectant transport system permease protein
VQNGEPLVRWDWVWSHVPDIQSRILEHLVLTGIAVGVGLALSFALAMLIRRFSVAAAPVTWAAGVLYTIPSIALFAMLIPFTGLSLLTSEIGLVSYTLLILIRGILGGLEAVPEEVRETAIGMGYTPAQLLWQVELPLALPIIIGGLRVAVITTIGLATVTALIGQGGLGFFILDGMQRFFTTPLLVGAVLSVALAVGADLALVLLQRQLTPWTSQGER